MIITQPRTALVVSRRRLRKHIEQVCTKVADATACRKLEQFLNELAEIGFDAVLNQFAGLRIRSTS